MMWQAGVDYCLDVLFFAFIRTNLLLFSLDIADILTNFYDSCLGGIVTGKTTASQGFDLSRVRTRIIGHIELMPGDILDHPGQAWDHPTAQAEALVGILEEVGIVDEILVYKSERANGAWVTPDGHLRKSLDPSKPWPCTVLDLTDAEADYVLATKDPVGMMKRTNAEALDALLSSVESGNKAVQEMLADVAAKAGLYIERGAPEVEFKEYDETAAAGVEYITCPECGHKWPK